MSPSLTIAAKPGILPRNRIGRKIMRKKASLAALAAIAAFVATFQAASANDMFPQCSEPFVTGRVIEKFNWADRHTWRTGVTMERIDHWEQRAVEAFGENPIYRRYCRGQATLSDGQRHVVHYRIERFGGIAGRTWNVDFCVPGNDRWKVYDGWCRVLVR
jgi:hypothetical protein